MLAIPMAMMTGSRSAGLAARRLGLFLIDEEQTTGAGEHSAQSRTDAGRAVHQS